MTPAQSAGFAAFSILYGNAGSEQQRRAIWDELGKDGQEIWVSFARAALRRFKESVDAGMNNHLCDMEPGYDDSITGFNEAWDKVRELFKVYES